MMKYFFVLILLVFLVGISDAVPYCPACSEAITGNIELNCSLNCTGGGLVMGADGVVVDCGGNSIAGSGSGSGYGVHIRQRKNTVVENCIIKGFGIGVYIEGVPSGESGSADNNIIRNSSISSNSEGVRIYACGCGGSHSNNNVLENNKIFNNTGYGVYFIWNSKYNKVVNSEINNNGYGVYIQDVYCQYNEINSSEICSNNFDIYLNSGTGNTGSNNTCNTTQNWKDSEASLGCAYKCGSGVNLSNSDVNLSCLPDFKAEKITYEPENPVSDNADINITVAVINSGNISLNLDSVNVSLFIDGEYKDDEILNFTNKTEINITFSRTFSPGEYNATVIIDPDNEIYEFNETNNNITFQISVSSGICFCSNCIECEEKLNSPSCLNVSLTSDIMTSGACIDNPENFNKKTFDCMGHKIEGGGTYAGIHLEGKTENTIKNCILNNFYYGIYAYESQNNRIINTSQNKTSLGIALYSSSNNQIINSTSEESYYGIYLYSSPNNEIINSSAIFSQYGMFMYYSSNNSITNNVLENNQYGIYIIFSGKNFIAENRIRQNNNGIYVTLNSDSNNLKNNEIKNNTINGIYFTSDSNKNSLNSNNVCFNSIDINETNSNPNPNSNSNSGENNTCNIAYGWNDTGNSGCSFGCSGCLGELEAVDSANGNLTCCSGLANISLRLPEEFGCSAESQLFVCTKCGDGICGERENYCNCPDDCGGYIDLAAEIDYYPKNATVGENITISAAVKNLGNINAENITVNILAPVSNPPIFNIFNPLFPAINISADSGKNWTFNWTLRYGKDTIKLLVDENNKINETNENNNNAELIFDFPVTVKTDKKKYAIGEPVNISITGRNGSGGIYAVPVWFPFRVFKFENESWNEITSNSDFFSWYGGSFPPYCENGTVKQISCCADYLPMECGRINVNSSWVWNQKQWIYANLTCGNGTYIDWINIPAEPGKYKVGMYYSADINIFSCVGIYAELYAESDNFTILPNCTTPHDDLFIEEDTLLCPGVYNINDSGADGALILKSGNVTLDCNNAVINGNGIGIGVYSNGFDNVTIKNCNLKNYSKGIYLQYSSNSTLANNTANSNNYNGIYLSYSSNSTLNNNTANSNGYGIILYSSSNNVLTNNKANLNSVFGIWMLYSPDKNALINNTANSNNFGIYLISSSNSTIINNTANSNNFGIYLEYSSNSEINNNTANSNNNAGIYLFRSSNFNKISNNKISNNTQYGIKLSDCNPFKWCPGGGNTENILLENEISNNSIGIYSQNSNSTIKSNFVCGNINQDFNSSSWLSSCGEKNTCDNPDGWDDNGKTGCTYACTVNVDCSCSSCSECTDKLNNPSCSIVTLDTSTISYNGTCIDNPANFNNKIFDCQGHKIDGIDTRSYGIYLNEKINNTIKNCVITAFDIGIYLISSSNNILTNSTVNSNSYGISLESSSNNTLNNNAANNNRVGIALDYSSNNTLTNSTGNSNSYGISLWYSSNSTITSSTGNYNDYGIYFYYSSSNTLTNSTANNNAQIGICLDYYSSKNTLNNNTANNNQYGLHINDGGSTNNNINSNTFCNNPSYDTYDADSNTGANNTCNTVNDYYDFMSSFSNATAYGHYNHIGCRYFCNGSENPNNTTIISGYYVTQNVSACQNITASGEYILTQNLTSSGGNCIEIQANNVVLNCQGHTIDGVGAYYGIYLNGKTNNIIDNCVITDFDIGIYLISSSNNILKNNTANNNYEGIDLHSSSNNTLNSNTANNNREGIALGSSSNNTLNSNTANNNRAGIALGSSSNNNLMTSNTGNYNDYGIYFDHSSNNTLTNSTANNNGAGIALEYYSSSNLLTNSTANNNSYYGIHLWYSSSSTIQENEISNNSIGIYSEYSTSTINSNFVCGNLDSDFDSSSDWLVDWDFSSSDWLSSSGENNTCDKPDGWKDDNFNEPGCRYNCNRINCDADGDRWLNPICDGTDCNDNNQSIHPNATEICNGIDDNCNGQIDERLTYYRDADNDSYGSETNNITTCNATVPEGYVINSKDCNDNNSAIHPGAKEIYNGMDDNCNGVIDETCDVYCDSCANCTDAINSASSGQTICLTNDIINFSGTCINNPANFNDKIFDCNNHKIDGIHTTMCCMSYPYGIYLSGKTNNIIENCVITDFAIGIYLSSSSNNIINNNTASDNGDFDIAEGYGILLDHSSNNTLIKNTANSNKYWGISSYYSSNNTLINNTVNSNRDGIYMFYSSNNTLIKNTIINNREGIRLSSSSNSILTNNSMTDNRYNFDLDGYEDSHFDNNIGTSNTVDSKPIYYLKNSTNTVYDSSTNAGVFYCIGCENVTIKDLTLTKNGDGIFFWKTNNSKIVNNTANNNYRGIDLWDSSNNILTSNTANNNRAGIALGSSSNNNLLSSNTANYNYNGILLYSSSNNNLTSNTANNNGYEGIGLDYSSNNILINNTANNIMYYSGYFDAHAGIHLSSSSNNILTNNTANNSINFGIALDYSSNNTLTSNTANNNAYVGIYLLSSSNNLLTGNTANNNGWSGISLDSSSNNTLNNNTANSNYEGIYLSDSLNNNLTNNTANNNNYDGIVLGYSSNNTLTNNTANNNGFWGILLYRSSNNTLTNNTANNNVGRGIYLYSSVNNILLENEISNNSIGIFSKNSNSTIKSNFVCNNNQSDLNSSDWQGSYGINNTCATGNWNDSNASGCAFSCFKETCMMKHNLSDSAVVFVHSNYCSHCINMMAVVRDLESKGYKFYWAEEGNSSAMQIVGDCLGSLLSGAVPQFICPLNNETIIGEVSEEVLENFTVRCGQKIYGIVKGSVINENGYAIENATVSLNGVSVQTNKSGEYFISALIGNYEIYVSAQSYYPSVKNVFFENKTVELNFTLYFASALNISGSVNASECSDTVNYSISYSAVCPANLNLTLSALTGNASVNISFGSYAVMQNLSGLTLNYSFYGVDSGELKITVCSHTVIYNISCKKAYGANCSADNECFGFCVHGKCRNSTTYCGDGYCDSKETCLKDCGSSGGSSPDSGTACTSCVSGGSGGGSSGGGSFYGGSYAGAEVPSGVKILSLSSPQGTVVSGVFNFTLKDDKNNTIANAKVSLTLENGSVIEKNTDKDGNVKFDLTQVYGKVKIKADKSGLNSSEKEFTLILGNLKINKTKGIKYGDEFEFMVRSNDFPVEGAFVEADNKIFRTDANGAVKAVISNIGDVYVKAEKEGYNKTSLEVNVKPKGSLKIIKPDEVKAGEAISIKVLDEYNNTVPDSTVYINEEIYTTGADGTVNVTLKEKGFVEFKAMKAGYVEIKDFADVKEEKKELKTKQEPEKENLNLIIAAVFAGLIILMLFLFYRNKKGRDTRAYTIMQAQKISEKLKLR